MVLLRSSTGVHSILYSPHTDAWTELPVLSAFPDSQGWAAPQYYETFQAVAVEGPSVMVTCRSSSGPLPFYLDRGVSGEWSWRSASMCSTFLDADGWAAPQYYMTMRLVALSNTVAVTARSSTGHVTYVKGSLDATWTPMAAPPVTYFSDAVGFANPAFYETCHVFTTDGCRLYAAYRASDAVHVLLLTP